VTKEKKEPNVLVDLKSTRKEIKDLYLQGFIGLSDAIPALMLEHDMMHSQALTYLGL
jgi:hypothetical protein